MEEIWGYEGESTPESWDPGVVPLEELLGERHLEGLQEIRDLMSLEDYAEVVASISRTEAPEEPSLIKLSHHLDSILEWDEGFTPRRPSPATMPWYPRDPRAGSTRKSRVGRRNPKATRGW